MTAQHPGELLERFEATVTGAPEPLQQVAARPCCAPIAPEATEILFEEVGSHDRTVEAEQRRKSRVLGLGEVLRILQPQEARVFELRLLGAG